MSFFDHDPYLETPANRREYLLLIRKYLEDRGITNKEFAARIGVSENTVGRWFLHGRFPQKKQLDRIIKTYGVTPPWVSVIDHSVAKTVQRGVGNVSNTLTGSFVGDAYATVNEGEEPLRPDVVRLARLIQDNWSPKRIREYTEELESEL